MHPVLANHDGQRADRVGGVLDENHNRFHEEKTVFFGFFESINDQEAAKWYRKYAPSDTVLEGLEMEAREGRIGLWADPQSVPPWAWRKLGRVPR
jgi:hypothetical protein